MKITFTTIAFLTSLALFSQNNVGIGTLTPNPNAKLEINSNDKGVLITRLTTIARNTLGTALTSLEDGMLVYDKDLKSFYYWNGATLVWVQVGSGSGDNWGTQTVQVSGANISGDGTVANPLTVTDGDTDATNEIELPATATTGQVLSWDGTNWVAQNATSGADNWGNDIVNTSGANITGDGTSTNPLTVTDGDSDATNEIELPTGGTNGQVLSTDGSGIYTWVSDNAGTDDQNISNLAFNNTTNILTVGIEGGNSQTIDLTSLVNDADNSITNEIQDLSINTTTNILTITNNGSATSIDLSSYLDNTDNQNLTSSVTGGNATINISGGTGTTFSINDADSDPSNEIELPTGGTNGQVLSTDGSGTYSWVTDNTGTDNQNISGSGLTGTNLTIGIQNGTNETIDLSSLVDHDWYKVSTTSAPTSINDNIFTQGIIGVGINTPIVSVHSQGSNFSSSAIYVDRIQTTANAGGFFGRHARGTIGSESAAINGDLAVNFGGVLYDGTNYNTIGMMAFYAEGNQTPSNKAGNFRIRLANAGGVSSTKMTVLSNGNVGIGIANPSGYMTSGTYTGPGLHMGGGTENFIKFQQNIANGRLYRFGISNVDNYFHFTGQIGGVGATKEIMTFSDIANVGINTITPSEKLHVYNGSAFVENSDTYRSALLSVDGALELYRSPSASSPSVNGFIDFKDNSSDDSDFRIYYNNTIGTNGGLVFSGSTTGTPTSTPHLVIRNQDGNVGVGTANPTEKLQVNGSVKIVDGTQGAGKVLTSDANGKASWQNVLPAGAVIPFNLATCPTGWAPADGTGGMPDLRGEFVRGLDNGRGVDVGRVLASSQGDAIRNISGTFGSSWPGDHATIGELSGAFTSANTAPAGDVPPYSSGGTRTRKVNFNSSAVVPTANENRPRNVALLYCVKQ